MEVGRFCACLHSKKVTPPKINPVVVLGHQPGWAALNLPLSLCPILFLVLTSALPGFIGNPSAPAVATFFRSFFLQW